MVALDNDKPSSEPALTVGASTTAITGALYFIVKYLFPQVPDEVLNSVAILVAIAIPFLTSWIIRSRVWSPKSVQDVVDEAVKHALATAQLLKSDQMKMIIGEVPPVQPEDH